MSILLLDDALKSTTPLTNGVINETLRQFAPLSNISQSNKATQLRCGGIFSDNLARLHRYGKNQHITPDISECPGLILTYFTGLVGVLVRMIILYSSVGRPRDVAMATS